MTIAAGMSCSLTVSLMYRFASLLKSVTLMGTMCALFVSLSATTQMASCPEAPLVDQQQSPLRLLFSFWDVKWLKRPCRQVAFSFHLLESGALHILQNLHLHVTPPVTLFHVPIHVDTPKVSCMEFGGLSPRSLF